MSDDEMADCSTAAIQQALQNVKNTAARICEAKGREELCAAAKDAIEALKRANQLFHNRNTLLEAVIDAFGGAVPLTDPWDDGALATLFKRGTVEGRIGRR